MHCSAGAVVPLLFCPMQTLEKAKLLVYQTASAVRQDAKLFVFGLGVSKPICTRHEIIQS